MTQLYLDHDEFHKWLNTHLGLVPLKHFENIMSYLLLCAPEAEEQDSAVEIERIDNPLATGLSLRNDLSSSQIEKKTTKKNKKNGRPNQDNKATQKKKQNSFVNKHYEL